MKVPDVNGHFLLQKANGVVESQQTTIRFEADNNFYLVDAATDKRARFGTGLLTGGVLRTLALPDADTNLVGDDVTQTLTNKTLDNTNTITVLDTNFTLQDDGNTAKQAQFNCSGISAGATRIISIPNAGGTIVLENANQTLTNKTLEVKVLVVPVDMASILNCNCFVLSPSS